MPTFTELQGGRVKRLKDKRGGSKSRPFDDRDDDFDGTPGQAHRSDRRKSRLELRRYLAEDSSFSHLDD